MQEVTEIPLFPLNVVLFPYSKLPLYIFEERYKKMINECSNNESEFGINLFAEKKIYSTGCSASVDNIVNRTDNGEMNIVTKGKRRYKIVNYELSSEGYYKGRIKFTEEESLNYSKEKMEKTVRIYNDLVELVYKGEVSKIELNDLKWYDCKRSVSFFMAEKSGLSLIERQNLLEIDTEEERLDFILKYFAEVVPKLKEADKVTNIIKSDGYIQQ